MNKSIFYYKQLTATEVGNKGTHEIYIRMPNDFNSEDFFQAELDSNNGVLEKKFKAMKMSSHHSKEVKSTFDIFPFFEVIHSYLSLFDLTHHERGSCLSGNGRRP